MSSRLLDVRDFAVSLVARATLGVAALLPYPTRVRGLVWVVSRSISPIAAFSLIVRDNLALTCPDLPEAERRRLARRVPDNAVRAFLEIVFGRDLAPYARAAPIVGDEGLAALKQAHAEGRGVFLMSAHLGNSIAAAIALRARGFRVGDIYRPLNNRWLAEIWADAIDQSVDGLFPDNRRGMAQMLGFLRDGGMVLVLNDRHSAAGAPLTCFGQTAYTATAVARMALKYDALMVPVYALRRSDLLSFEVVVEPPIPHSTPERMTQQCNDGLERLVRQNMDQWLWVYRRWKPRRGCEQAAVSLPTAQRTDTDAS